VRIGSPQSDSVVDRNQGWLLDVASASGRASSRDRRFDGQFFSGVRDDTHLLSSVCPVRPRRRKNVSLLSIRSGGGARWISALLALPAGDGAVLSGMKGSFDHGRTCGPADQRGRTRSRVCCKVLAAALAWGRGISPDCSTSTSAPAGSDCQDGTRAAGEATLDDTRLPMIEIALRAVVPQPAPLQCGPLQRCTSVRRPKFGGRGGTVRNFKFQMSHDRSYF
jgi:hypothetical protein